MGMVVDAIGDGLMALLGRRKSPKSAPPVASEVWVAAWPKLAADPTVKADYYYWLWALAAKQWPEERFMCGPAGLPAVTAIGWVKGEVIVELMDVHGDRERFSSPPARPPEALRCASV